jgi:hypothetical protein
VAARNHRPSRKSLALNRRPVRPHRRVAISATPVGPINSAAAGAAHLQISKSRSERWGLGTIRIPSAIRRLLAVAAPIAKQSDMPPNRTHAMKIDRASQHAETLTK